MKTLPAMWKDDATPALYVSFNELASRAVDTPIIRTFKSLADEGQPYFSPKVFSVKSTDFGLLLQSKEQFHYTCGCKW